MILCESGLFSRICWLLSYLRSIFFDFLPRKWTISETRFNATQIFKSSILGSTQWLLVVCCVQASWSLRVARWFGESVVVKHLILSVSGSILSNARISLLTITSRITASASDHLRSLFRFYSRAKTVSDGPITQRSISFVRWILLTRASLIRLIIVGGPCTTLDTKLWTSRITLIEIISSSS